MREIQLNVTSIKSIWSQKFYESCNLIGWICMVSSANVCMAPNGATFTYNILPPSQETFRSNEKLFNSWEHKKEIGCGDLKAPHQIINRKVASYSMGKSMWSWQASGGCLQKQKQLNIFLFSRLTNKVNIQIVWL